MLEYELKFMLQAPYDPKGNYSTNQNTAHAIQRIKWAHMQQKLTKTEGHSPELGLRAHRAALQPKLGVVRAHMGSADRLMLPLTLPLGVKLPCDLLKSVLGAFPAATQSRSPHLHPL